jgi:FAD/FMN-containing dehydrogenase
MRRGDPEIDSPADAPDTGPSRAPGDGGARDPTRTVTVSDLRAPAAANWREAHAERVARLTAEFRAIPPEAPVRLAKKTSNLFRARAATRTPGLDVSGLDHVLAVDPVARRAQVEGMVTYERLVDATLPYGLMPLVVPQLKTITLGGAVTGMGIES